MICVAFDVSAGPVRKELRGWKPSKFGSGGGGASVSVSRSEPRQKALASASRWLRTSTPSARRSPMAATARGRFAPSMARRTDSSKPSTAASGRPICSRSRQVMTRALGIEGARSTAAAAQRSAASVSLARRSARARSIGESVVWAPGRSGGATRMGPTILSLLLGFFLAPFGALHELAHGVRRGSHQGQNARVVHGGRADDADRAGRVAVRRVPGPHDPQGPAAQLPGPVPDDDVPTPPLHREVEQADELFPRVEGRDEPPGAARVVELGLAEEQLLPLDDQVRLDAHGL